MIFLNSMGDAKAKEGRKSELTVLSTIAGSCSPALAIYLPVETFALLINLIALDTQLIPNIIPRGAFFGRRQGTRRPRLA